MAGDSSEPAQHPTDGHAKGHGFWVLTIGSIGVVFGDIGTSPLYALREALHHSKGGGTGELAVLGVVSLAFWALMLVVTLKYAIFLMRADNKGEGGTLALMALAQRALARKSAWVLGLGMVGAALFYGDGIITPAMSVLSAVEGLKSAPGMGKIPDLAMPVTAGIILIILFMVQSRGTASMARFFGPLTAVWFLVLAGLGLLHIHDDLSVFRALSPYYGVKFLIENGALGFVIL
ncbi:MAG: KUP/HAK/KT family potassium transporter, partial [Alphaproteobacteria bacterium]